jgi:hypothetical protein
MQFLLDVFFLIAKRLDFFDLGRLQQVCKRYHQLVKCTPDWVELFEGVEEVVGERTKRFRAQSGPGLRPFSLTLIGPKGCGKTTTILVYTTNGVPSTEYLPRVVEGCAFVFFTLLLLFFYLANLF